MKKTLKTSATLLCMVLTILALSSYKGDCSLAVDKICYAFDSMKGQVKKCNSVEEMAGLDFDKSISSAGIEQIPDECASYVLTSEDKSRIIKSFNGIFDALADKTVELSGGMIPRSEIEKELKGFKTTFTDLVKKSTTLGNLADNMQKM